MKKITLALGVATLLSGTTVWAADAQDGQWRGSGTLAFSKSSGNTNSSILSASVNEARATAEDKWSLYGNALYGSSQGVKNNDNLRGGARYDYNLSPKSFVFGLGELERNTLANLNLRTTLGSGFGYHVIQDADTTFDVMGGLGFSQTQPQLGNNTTDVTLLLGEESTHKLTDTSMFKQKLMVYPSVKNGGQYRSVFDASYVVDITKTVGLSLGFQQKYNTEVVAPVKRSDTLFLTGINVKF